MNATARQQLTTNLTLLRHRVENGTTQAIRDEAEGRFDGMVANAVRRDPAFADSAPVKRLDGGRLRACCASGACQHVTDLGNSKRAAQSWLERFGVAPGEAAAHVDDFFGAVTKTDAKSEGGDGYRADARTDSTTTAPNTAPERTTDMDYDITRLDAATQLRLRNYVNSRHPEVLGGATDVQRDRATLDFLRTELSVRDLRRGKANPGSVRLDAEPPREELKLDAEAQRGLDDVYRSVDASRAAMASRSQNAWRATLLSSDQREGLERARIERDEARAEQRFLDDKFKEGDKSSKWGGR